MSSYQMKKSLRRTPGAPKSYAQLDEEAENIDNQDRKDTDPREIIKESIFQHKNWSVKEKIRLMVFFAYYLGLPDWNSERRSIHLYKHLSNFMKKKRTPEQCKNIHSLLKRKFIKLEEVIEAMRVELEGEENYQRLLSKYEKEIDAYELDNKLKDKRSDEQKYESLRSRRVMEKDQKKQAAGGDVFLKQDINLYRIQKEGGQYNNNPFIKREEGPRSQFQIQREKLIKQCNFYFKQWLKYTLVYKQRESALKSE